MPSIVLISDTHGLHNSLKDIPLGEILIHCGDLTAHSDEWSLREFLQWFESQPHNYKVFICGNHETWPEKNPRLFEMMVKEYAPNCIYLHDSGCEIEGLKFFGSPYTPAFCGWAYNCERGEEIKRHWDMIPDDTDVLITHGPPKGYGDWSVYDKIHCGCEDLLEAIKRVKCKIACHGHVHFAAGKRVMVHEDGKETIIVNASICDETYSPVNKPWVIDL